MDYEKEILNLLQRHKDGITLEKFKNVYFENDITFKDGKQIKVGENILFYLERLEKEGEITYNESVAKLK
jgi:hypothetical protein